MQILMIARRILLPSSLVLCSACGSDSTAPPDIDVPLEFSSVRAGPFRTCGLTTDGEAYCWGIQELNVADDSIIYTEPTAVPDASALQFESLDIAGNYTCAVTAAGTAYCWGGRFSNSEGALGRGSADTSAHTVPAAVVGGHTFASVSTGAAHACGLTTDGSVYCWGSNELGKLGDGTTTPSSVPVLVSGAHAFRFVSAGAQSTCALTLDDDAYCWGSGILLGDGTTIPDPGSSTPVPVSGGHKFSSVSVGEQAVCGVTTAGAAYCWGWYDTVGGAAASYVPVRVASALTFAVMSVSIFHFCGIASNSAAYCWGFNGNGQLGNGSTTDSPTPVLVSGALHFESISAGLFHTCGVTAEPVAYCWGSGFVGVLGDGAMMDRTTPVRVSGQ